MALWTALGLGAGATVGTAAAAAVVVIGAVGYFVILPQFDDPEPEVTEVVVQEDNPVPVMEDPPAAPELEATDDAPTVDDSTPAPEVAEVEEPTDEPAPTVPSFDVARVDAQGSALVAGIADANLDVQVLLDGAVLSETRSGSDGRFVAMFDITPSGEPRTLQLSAVMGEMSILPDQTILVAPFGMPVEVADAEVEPEPAVEPVEVAEAEVGAGPQAELPAVEEPVVEPVVETAEVETEAVVEDTQVAETVVEVAPEPAPEPEPVAEPEPAPEPDLPNVTVVAQAPSAPQLLIASSEGVRVLQSAPAPVTQTQSASAPRVNVTIDTISYDAEGAVEIAGRGQGGGFARIYLDNMVRETVAVGTQGTWSARMPDIEPGIYTMRIDELDAAGNVTSRFETPFKREDPEILAAAQAALQPQESIAQGSNNSVVEPETVEITEAPVALEPSPNTEPTQSEAVVVAETEDAPLVVPEVTPAETQVAVSAPQAPEPATRPTVSVITVQPGFTLWQIARDMMGEGEMYVQVYEANREQIRDPDLIYPGQVFTMPASDQ